MLPAVLSGVFASLCWIIGDLLIVGFTPAPEKYPLLSEIYTSQIDVGLATLMLSGSTNRLMWGALIAVFSVPFYLYATFAVSCLIKRKFMMPVFLLLLLGFAYARTCRILLCGRNIQSRHQHRCIGSCAAAANCCRICQDFKDLLDCIGWIYGCRMACLRHYGGKRQNTVEKVRRMVQSHHVFYRNRSAVPSAAFSIERPDRLCHIQRGTSGFLCHVIIHCAKETGFCECKNSIKFK